MLRVLSWGVDWDGALHAAQVAQLVSVAVSGIVQGVASLELLAKVAAELAILHPYLKENKSAIDCELPLSTFIQLRGHGKLCLSLSYVRHANFGKMA